MRAGHACSEGVRYLIRVQEDESPMQLTGRASDVVNRSTEFAC